MKKILGILLATCFVLSVTVAQLAHIRKEMRRSEAARKTHETAIRENGKMRKTNGIKRR